MVARSEAWPAGTPCGVDLAVVDVDKAIEFYRGLFGWDVERDGGYATCRVGGRTVAGIGRTRRPGQPNAWTTYLAVADVDATARKVAEAGGRVLAGPLDVPAAGRLIMAVDPAGAVFGGWQAGRRIGAELANEVSSLVWNEQLSNDLDGTRRFYAEVFGYTYDDVSFLGNPYAMLRVGGAVAGGLGMLGSGPPVALPAHWRVHFLVPRTDAAVARVTALGGRVLAPPVDTPYGRLAVVRDDQDAMFVLIQGS